VAPPQAPTLSPDSVLNCVVMSWSELPVCLVADVCNLVAADSTLTDVVSLSLLSKTTHDICQKNGLYASVIRRRWGPLDFDSYFARTVPCGAKPGPGAWLRLNYEMEQLFTPCLCQSIKQASCWLHSRRLLTGERNGSHALCEQGHMHELRWLAHLIADAPLQLRRRIASYVCTSSELYPKAHLDSYLSNFRFTAATTPSQPSQTIASDIDMDGSCEARNVHGNSTPDDPVDVLRRVLLQFPFLPIDAGGGADRTIGSLARCYVAAVPAVSEWLGHAVALDRASTVEAVHLILYSLIMLNTDLHNPANIANRMSAAEYQESLYRVAMLRALPPTHIYHMYEAIKREPLRIDAQKEGVDTIIRATLSNEANDEISGTKLSRYSRQIAPLYRCRKLAHRARRLTKQLSTAEGRAGLRFHCKRWYGRHYAELRGIAIVTVVGCAVYWLGCLMMLARGNGASVDTLSQGLIHPTVWMAACIAALLHVTCE